MKRGVTIAIGMGIVLGVFATVFPASVAAEDAGCDGAWLQAALVVVRTGGEGSAPHLASEHGLTERRSRSIGQPDDGGLQGGRQLPRHAAYVVRDPDRAWATATTVDWLVEGFNRVTRAGVRVQVLDVSLPSGGPMNGHRSHQSGRDVDVAYYRQTCETACGLRRTVPRELDAAAQWSLLRYWLEHDRVEFVFVDYALQGLLYEAAARAGASPQQLARWFQWPRGPEHRTGVIRHVDNHDNHFHVRFACPPRDSDCTTTRQGRRPRGDVNSEGNRSEPGIIEETEAEESRLLELLEEYSSPRQRPLMDTVRLTGHGPRE